MQLNISTNENLDYFILFGTILGYNFLKYFEVFWNRIFTIKKNYWIILVCIFSIFAMFFYFLKLENTIQIESAKIGFLVIIYPFTRKYGFLKMIIVAFCVSYITVFIPNIDKLNGFYFFQRFLLVFCLLIPLEICDFETDSKTIKTLPKIIGIDNLKFYDIYFFFCLVF